MKRYVAIPLVALFVVLLGLFSLTIESSDFLWVLLTGWWHYLSDVLPRVRWNLESWGVAALFLVSGGLGLHWVLAWWSRKRQLPPWRIRQTSLLLAMGSVACATALASAGILHHSAWLLSAREPLFEDASRAVQTRKLSTIKQVGLGLLLWQSDHDDRMPAMLDELVPDYIPVRDLLVEGNLNYQLVVPWEFFGSGRSEFPPDAILLASSQDDRGTRVVVFGDQSGRIISEAEYLERRARYPDFLAP